MVAVFLSTLTATNSLATAHYASKGAFWRVQSGWRIAASTHVPPSKAPKKRPAPARAQAAPAPTTTADKTKKSSPAAPVRKAAAKSKTAKEPSVPPQPTVVAATDVAAKQASLSDSADQNRGEGPDLLAKKFAELLSQRRAKGAPAVASVKTPQERPKEQAPKASASEPAPGPKETGDESPTIHVLVVRNSDDLADVPRTERIGQLTLSGDAFSNRSLRGLEGLTVSELSIEAIHVSNAGLQHVESVRGVRRLRLWAPVLNDEALTHVAKLSNLEILDIEGTAVEGAGLEELKGLQKLDTLVLGPKTSDAQIASLQHLPALRQLDLRACSRLTLACLEPLAQLADLETVWLPSHIRTKGKRMLKESLSTCEVRS
ncbi:MAG: leucine-rich repeat domain-containing protein [Pirellulaceae bacterium]